jgi:hypothetical protein
MPDRSLLALTWRIMRRRLLSSPLTVGAGLAFPAFIAWVGISHSYGTAAKFFFFLLPHMFLISVQDTVRSDIEGGALENVLFLGGRFRGFLSAKSFVLAAAVAGYAAGLFGFFAGWGLVVGGLDPVFVGRFALSLLAGAYYVAVAGILSHFLRGAANVLLLLLAQSAAVIGLPFLTTSRNGLLDYAATGHFPGLGPKLLFGALVGVLPNVVVSGRLPYFAGEVLAGLGLALFVRERLIRRLEIRR